MYLDFTKDLYIFNFDVLNTTRWSDIEAHKSCQTSMMELFVKTVFYRFFNFCGKGQLLKIDRVLINTPLRYLKIEPRNFVWNGSFTVWITV